MTVLYTNLEAINYCSHFGFNKTGQGKLLSVDTVAEMVGDLTLSQPQTQSDAFEADNFCK